ncbi:MAG: dipeptidase [Bacteroidota bacterium]
MKYLGCILTICLLLACGSKKQPEKATNNLATLADSLAQRYLIVDGHVDLPYRLRVKNFRLEREYLGIPLQTDDGDFDYERARSGGLDAPFMSIYIPSSYQESGGAKELADSLIDMVSGIAQAHPNKFAITTSPSQLVPNQEKGIISLPMGMENGAPIGDELDNVNYFHERGIRYITLTHATDNQISDSSYDSTRTWKGLSPFGEQVVRRMNQVGIMVDISHVSDQAFFDVMELTDVPVIASHSSARRYTPGFERNMSDEMIERLARNNGVIMINFGTDFLDGTMSNHNDSLRTHFNEQLEQSEIDRELDSLAYEEFVELFQAENPRLFADVETVADHIEHVVHLAGVEHVGLGSDFDGVGDSLPTGLKDVTAYPNLIHVLLKRGYSPEDIEKICSGNLIRVWRAVEAAAD